MAIVDQTHVSNGRTVHVLYDPSEDAQWEYHVYEERWTNRVEWRVSRVGKHSRTGWGIGTYTEEEAARSIARTHAELSHLEN